MPHTLTTTDTGKPWLLDMCSNILGWLGTNVVMSSPQSLADSYTFRDITAVNSTGRLREVAEWVKDVDCGIKQQW